ncbi:MAG: DEAD/DEAH box helicase [Rickettsiales bacterium]|jgi:transcription-repair coupling factor (superfamily II helicase)|nr:DEAD/DEAH box helicase [Rickettsiales bacterium]
MALRIREDDIPEEDGPGQSSLSGFLDRILREQSSLRKGNLVIHSDYGLGRFIGLETIEIDGNRSDFIRIEYRNSASLLVPVENCDLITKYGESAGNIKLDSLGSKTWTERKAKIREKIKNIATKLIATASARKLKSARIFSLGDGEYEEFCGGFPFEPTPDQLKAVEEIRSDLASGIAMDRLLCGDVGYGKTEVALRAAFIVAGGDHGRRGQVVLVAPTTLLCRQHYDKFLERFRGTDVVIRSLSRYNSRLETQKIGADLENGLVDILICTHAIFSENVRFRNLGLVIVDEEQRFGVNQKEKLKELEINSHLLSMTATPIPRTLQMAMAGIRDVSLLATAPANRSNVITIVSEYRDSLMEEALERELARDGRVFIVVPRIADIAEVRARLKMIMPDLDYYVIHGRMSSEESGRIMNEFYDGLRRVLIATTIVENGIDIALANTLIVYRANNFGLAQLYQLRGRVGRNRVQGYAYLTVKKNEMITDSARRRLEIIGAIDSLGAGFVISSEDMEIRGAGNILGESQTGHMREVGLELYNSMLEKALENHRNSGGSHSSSDQEWEFSPEIRLNLPSTIPPEYIANVSVRIKFYRRIATLRGEEDRKRTEEELRADHGEIPKSISNLMDLSLLRLRCRGVNVQRLVLRDDGLLVCFHRNLFPNPERLLAYTVQHRDTVRLSQENLLFGVNRQLDPLANAESVLGILEGLR